MPHNTGFAKQRFPEHGEAIDALAARSESFRDLCVDFEAAEKIRQQWQASTAPEAPARLAELTLLVHDLSEEMRRRLDGASVIPFDRPKPKR